MRQRSAGMLILVLSIAAGLTAALMSVSYMKQTARKTDVVVVKQGQEIQAYQALDPAMFELKEMAADSVPVDAVTDVSELTGRYARGLLVSGTIVQESYLATATGTTGSLAAKLTDTGDLNARALAIPVDHATGVGGTIEAGDKVDIVVSVKIEQEKGTTQAFSKVIARGVPVLFRTEPDETDTSGKATVVVQVSLEQAEDITFALGNGTVYLMTNPYKTEAEPKATIGTTADSFVERHLGR